MDQITKCCRNLIKQRNHIIFVSYQDIMRIVHILFASFSLMACFFLGPRSKYSTYMCKGLDILGQGYCVQCDKCKNDFCIASGEESSLCRNVKRAREREPPFSSPDSFLILTVLQQPKPKPNSTTTAFKLFPSCPRPPCYGPHVCALVFVLRLRLNRCMSLLQDIWT